MQRAHHRTKTLLAGLTCLWFGSAEAIVINEIRIDQSGADNSEYFELAGLAGESLAGLSYLVIGDSSSDSFGVLESVTDLSGYAIAADGYFLAAESTFALGDTVDFVTTLNFENSDNVTHLLVSGFSGSLGNNLDTDDGVLDSTPWLSILDSVALLETIGSGDGVYSSTQVGAGNGDIPAHVYRAPDSYGTWRIGTMNTTEDTAGRANVTVPEPSSIMLMSLGLLAFGATRVKGKTT
jgi:hypothetical protein